MQLLIAHTQIRLQAGQNSTKRERTAGGNRRRWLRASLWSAGTLVVLIVVALHVGAWVIGRHEQPERLSASIQIAEFNGFKVLWAEKRATNAGLTIVFVHGTPARAGVW